ncbi:hypothetical protein [Bacillus cereus]|uniref:hypothetical protein n=1 Tax=Bacillus cereus TaxID=1396 RepID=UPI000169B1EE|nr:hypothetical protein [Bacillus cereus]
MRYTRNRQIKKANEDYFYELIKKNFPIEQMKMHLDSTFKWHRDCYPWGHNWVEFGYGDSHTLVKSK